MMICRLCGSRGFRCSHFRASDLRLLLFLHFPVRCRNCGRRDFAELRDAWAIRRADRVRRRGPRNEHSVSE